MGAERVVAGRLPHRVAGDRDGAEGAAVVGVPHRRTWLALRAVSAAASAVSLASEPELVKNTLASGMPESFAIFSASSTWLRIR